MFECFLALICILKAVFDNNPLWAVAAAIFAIAMHLKDVAKNVKKDGENDA